MRKYELNLDDDSLDDFLNDLRNGLGGELALEIANALEEQRPIEAPTGHGAIVRTERGIYVLADKKDPALPWIFISTQDPDDSAWYGWYAEPAEKIVAILFPGTSNDDAAGDAK